MGRKSAICVKRRKRNLDQHVLSVKGYLLALEPLNSWVCVEFNGEIIPQSDRVIKFHEARLMPASYYPINEYDHAGRYINDG